MDLAAPEWRLAWDVAQFALTGAVGVYVYFSQRAQVRREALATLENDVDTRLDAVVERLGKIEGYMQHAPDPVLCARSRERVAVIEQRLQAAVSSEDIGRVHARIDTLAENLSGMRGELTAVVRLLTTIDTHLRSNHA